MHTHDQLSRQKGKLQCTILTSLFPRHLYSLLVQQPQACTHTTNFPIGRANCNVHTLLGFVALPLWDRFHFVPLIWLHENSGRVMTGFADRSKTKVILTLVYVGVRVAYLPRVAILFGNCPEHSQQQQEIYASLVSMIFVVREVELATVGRSN